MLRGSTDIRHRGFVSREFAKLRAEAVPWNQRAREVAEKIPPRPRPKPSVRRALFQEGESLREDKTKPVPVQPPSKGVNEDDKILIEQFIRDGADPELVKDLLRKATEYYAKAMLPCSRMILCSYTCVIKYVLDRAPVPHDRCSRCLP